MSLPSEEYLNVIKNTHLVSVDVIPSLINKNKDRAPLFLLGKRKNNPAKDCFFFPGCRLWKTESVEDCFNKCVKTELGLENKYTESSPVGVYIHEYPNNFLNDNFGTKYIVFARTISLHKDEVEIAEKTMLSQHSEVKWMTIDEIKKEAHVFSKYYFDFAPPNKLV